MIGSFRVESDDIGTGFGEIRNDAIHGLDHQVHVDDGIGHGADGFTHQRTDGQVGNIMVVHHVKVNNIGAGGDHISDFLAQFGHVGREYAWCNPELFSHGNK